MNSHVPHIVVILECLYARFMAQQFTDLYLWKIQTSLQCFYLHFIPLASGHTANRYWVDQEVCIVFSVK